MRLITFIGFCFCCFGVFPLQISWYSVYGGASWFLVFVTCERSIPPPPSPSPTFPNEAGRKVSLHQKQRNLPKSSTLSDIPFHWESLRLRDFIAFYVLKIKYTPALRCEHDFPAKRRDPILASCGISKHVRLFYKWLLLSLKTVTLFWHRGETSIISHSLPTPPPPITFKVALVLYWPALLSNQ